jgi:hypothetical protein
VSIAAGLIRVTLTRAPSCISSIRSASVKPLIACLELLERSGAAVAARPNVG